MDNLELKQFNDACEEFLLGKYILASLKIKAIINTINNSNHLSDILENALSELDFDIAFTQSVTEHGLVLPKTDKQIIAYCYHVLYNIDEGTISFLEFLNKYFSYNHDTGIDQFKLFADTIIKPFSEAVNRLYLKTYSISETVDYQSNVYHKLINVAQIHIDNINDLKLKEIEKEELALLLKALINQSEKSDKKQVYALMVGLEYFVKCNKRAKDIYLQLKDCFIQN